MTWEEANNIRRGTKVVYLGKVTEVLSVENRSVDGPYLRLAGVKDRLSGISYVLVDLPPRGLRIAA